MTQPISSEEGYGRPSAPPTGGLSYVRSNSHYGSDPMQGSYSAYQYHRIRPAASTNYIAVKKPPAYFGKGKIVKISDPTVKPATIKYKKVAGPLSHYPNHLGYKKTVHPKIHNPYVVHKYPTNKKGAVPVVVHPYYKKYYPYYNPQYLQHGKNKRPYEFSEPYNYYKHPESTQTTPYPDNKISSTTERYPTTERMDGVFLEKPLSYEDYTNYNDTYHKSNRINYTYETYEEPEEASSEVGDEGYEHEATTRGYYGDRIYMSTQGPEKKAADRKGSNNRLYFVRSEARDDEDSETIFD